MFFAALELFVATVVYGITASIIFSGIVAVLWFTVRTLAIIVMVLSIPFLCYVFYVACQVNGWWMVPVMLTLYFSMMCATNLVRYMFKMTPFWNLKTWRMQPFAIRNAHLFRDATPEELEEIAADDADEKAREEMHATFLKAYNSDFLTDENIEQLHDEYNIEDLVFYPVEVIRSAVLEATNMCIQNGLLNDKEDLKTAHTLVSNTLGQHIDIKV